MDRHATHRRTTALALSLLLSPLACTSRGSETENKAANKSESEGTELAPVPPEATIDPVSEAEAKAVFDVWLSAQVEGDFGAYQGVFASDFHGIKRTGHRRQELDRAAWLASREKMFDRGFGITATGVGFEAVETVEGVEAVGTMRARFTQRWATPTFADIGPKELRFARRDGEVSIVHEEMLSSHVTRRQGRVDTPLPVLSIGDAHYAVLGNGRPGWVDNKAEPALLDDSTVFKPLVEGKLTKAAKGWIGSELDVAGADGAHCRAKITGLEVVGRVVPFLEMDDDLAEIYDRGEEPSDAQLAAAMWSAINPELFLVARLDACAGDLALPVANAGAAKVAGFELQESVEPALAKALGEAFVVLPGYAENQASYLEEGQYGEPVSGKWDAAPASSLTQLWVAGDQRYLFHSVAVGEGCGDWIGSQWALWRVGDEGALELVGSGDEADGSMGGAPLRPQRLLAWHDEIWLRTTHELYEVQPRGDAMLISSTEPVFFGCPC